MKTYVDSLRVIRRVLNEFCGKHELNFDDEVALDASKKLISFCNEGEQNAVQLLAYLEQWHRHIC